jgi:hypothetical protein
LLAHSKDGKEKYVFLPQDAQAGQEPVDRSLENSGGVVPGD